MNIIGHYLFRNDGALLRQLLTIYRTELKYPRYPSPTDADLNSLLRRKDLIFYVVMDGKKVVGGLTAHVLKPVFGGQSSVYLQDIAVKKSYQRKKAGTHLLKCLIIECRVHKYKDIYVQAKQSNKAAIRLFKSRNATPTQGFHFEYEKVIRVK